ncbi:hypothetical protein F4809DRAFT_614214, partial [Biscogniauxia mediterranea]
MTTYILSLSLPPFPLPPSLLFFSLFSIILNSSYASFEGGGSLCEMDGMLGSSLLLVVVTVATVVIDRYQVGRCKV